MDTLKKVFSGEHTYDMSPTRTVSEDRLGLECLDSSRPDGEAGKGSDSKSARGADKGYVRYP